MNLAGRIELVVSRPGHPERRLLLRPGVLHMGRAEGNELVLADVGVSRRHARIIVDEQGVFVEDLGSGNGTLYHGEPVRRQRIQSGDEITIDPFLLHFRLEEAGPAPMKRLEEPAAASLVVLAGESLAESYPIPPSGLTIGRATDQLVVLHDPSSSRRHLIISPRQNGYWLEDNGSANGTFVNGARVWQHMLQDGDVIRIGHTEFRFDVIERSRVSDPFSRLWEESGVWQRQIRDDDDAPPPVVQPVESEAETAHIPPRRRLSRRVLIALGIAAVAGAAIAVAGGWQLMVLQRAQQHAALPAPVLLPPAPQLAAEDALAVRQQRIQAERLLDADRPLEAATWLYKAQRLSPSDAVLVGMGYQACEEAVFQALRDDLTRRSVDAREQGERYRQALRIARRASPEDLPAARAALADALVFYPGDRDLLLALAEVDAALTELADALVERSEGLTGEEQRTALRAAQVLVPDHAGAAAALAAIELSVEPASRAMIEQAMRLELLGHDAAALRLYRSAREPLDANHPLARLAAARIDAMSR